VDWTSSGYRLCGHKVTYQITYACRNINKWLNNNIQLHFIMKHFNMIQWRVLCPHNHLLKTTTTTGDIRELSSPRDVQSASWQSASWHIRELSSYPLSVSSQTHKTVWWSPLQAVNVNASDVTCKCSYTYLFIYTGHVIDWHMCICSTRYWPEVYTHWTFSHWTRLGFLHCSSLGLQYYLELVILQN